MARRRPEDGRAGTAPKARSTAGEPRLQGWGEIAPVLGWTKRTAMRHREELRVHKAIFYQWLGKPPRLTVCSYPSLLHSFLVER
jgi:hypothetical protein